ncbi:uncharacterized protein LOC144159077 [Haemaphysalis longicornis]
MKQRAAAVLCCALLVIPFTGPIFTVRPASASSPQYAHGRQWLLATTPEGQVEKPVSAGLNNSRCNGWCNYDDFDHESCTCRKISLECSGWRECCKNRFFEVSRPGLACVPAFTTHLLAIAQCPEAWFSSEDNNTTRIRCEDEERSGLELSYLDDLPVLSRHSGVIYRNVYCASCNGDTRDLRPWELIITCLDENGSNALKNGMAERIWYYPEVQVLVASWGAGIHLTKCEIAIKELVEPSSPQELNVTVCEPRSFVMSCPDDFSNGAALLKCYSYISAEIAATHGKLYPNMHCSTCDGRTRRLPRCGHQDGPQHSPGLEGKTLEEGAPTYAVVIDFSNWRTVAVTEPLVNSCGRDEVYDPVAHQCVHTGCPADVWVKRDDCSWTRLSHDEVRVRKDLTLIVNSSFQELKPDRWHRDGPDAVIACMSTSSERTVLKPGRFEDILSTAVLLISVLCLVLHIITYSLLPKLRNGPSTIVLCLALSVLVAQGTFVGGGLLLAPGTASSRVCAVVSHASHLAAFFWMNVLAIDVQETFRKGVIGMSRAVSAFWIYSSYAWLSPIAIVVAPLTLEHLQPASPWSPSYGRPRCWINRPLSLIAFFGTPVLLLLLTNLVLFCLTARSILQATRQAKLARRAVNRPNHKKGRLVLYAKLAAVFGLTWVFGFAASLSGLRFLWYPFIALCGLQGAFIFLAFTCKRRIFRMASLRIPHCTGDEFAVCKVTLD